MITVYLSPTYSPNNVASTTVSCHGKTLMQTEKDRHQHIIRRCPVLASRLSGHIVAKARAAMYTEITCQGARQ